MRLTTTLTLIAGLLSVSANAAKLRPRDYEAYDYYALHLSPSTSPRDLATHLGLELEGQLGELQNHYLFRRTKHNGDLIADALEDLRLRRRKRGASWEPHILDGVKFNQKQKLKPRHHKRNIPPPLIARAGPQAPDEEPAESAVQRLQEVSRTLGVKDPIFKEQWHLLNTIQPGHDMNVTGVWMAGNTGKNVTACIVDDGLDMYSEDLKDNYFQDGSYDFNEHVDEPKPRLSDDRHGTRCAGEVAAGKNNACGVGVAWDAKISALRILSKPITDADEAIAMNYAFDINHIYSCSWGPPDDGRSMEAPGILIKRAMVNAVQKGRGGLGSIYVFAAGNGANYEDNCNFDGYTNSIYSVTVGAIDRKGQHPYYSEKCSAQLIVTYSSGSGDSIHTTDVGQNTCTASHGGTSAAGPLAVGVYALVLSERPDLTWRDIQHLTVKTAVQVDQESDWQLTANGKNFSHQYGYGKLDAWAIVEAAKDWKVVKPQGWYHSPWIHVNHDIPQGNQGLVSTFEITEDALKSSNFEQIEHVTVTMNIEHMRRGDLSVEMRSPSGVVSHLSTTRRNDDLSEGYVDWTFMSVAHWGESGVGNWTVVVKDTIENEFSGTFTDWRIKLWGSCIDPTIQELLPLPEETDDDNHAATTTAAVGTTSVAIPTSSGEIMTGVPSDHPNRPVNSKTSILNPATTLTPSVSLTTPFEPALTASPTDSPSSSSSSSTGLPTEVPADKESNFLPSPFPTFGVSKRTQVWIYGAMGLIVVFIVSLGVYFYLARRKRIRNSYLSRDNYEFEVLDEEDEEGDYRDAEGNAAAGVAKGKKGKRRSKRAGELYDAFAGESDEELFSEEEREEAHRGKGYRDKDER